MAWWAVLPPRAPSWVAAASLLLMAAALLQVASSAALHQAVCAGAVLGELSFYLE